jgi:uncharacterized membrane protein YagU involved in acid resistance
MNRWSIGRAMLVGGLVGGALDLLFALTFAYSNGTPPLRLLQAIASGILGEASYTGGAATAALGFGAHFFISLALASFYVLASRRFPLLVRHAIFGGAVFGIAVLLFMRLVVLPISAFPHPMSFKPLATALDLLSHMFLFGVPIALAARKASVHQRGTPEQ